MICIQTYIGDYWDLCNYLYTDVEEHLKYIYERLQETNIGNHADSFLYTFINDMLEMIWPVDRTVLNDYIHFDLEEDLINYGYLEEE